MTAVLVTGATTPLGQRTVAALVDDPRVDRVVAVGIESRAQVFPTREPKLDYHQVDLTRTRQLRRFVFGAVKDAEVDVVLHGALHRSALDTGRKVHALNVRCTRDMLAMAERHPTIRRFVFRSHVDVYRLRGDLPDMVREDHPIQLDGRAPQWLRDRVEADLAVSTRVGNSPLQIVVLRCAECPTGGIGSQLFDYLQSSICLRPLGYELMINLISADDLVRALTLAVTSDAEGVFNIPGRDTLPLSATIRMANRRDVAVPGPLMGPLYKLRRALLVTNFRYSMNKRRFHYNAVMDGGRAAEVLGYRPGQPIDWDAPSRAPLAPRRRRGLLRSH